MRIFNRIRKKLLTELKIKNYFFYALGEIVLIVVGVLIAFQLNNWNEQRKAKIATKNVLINLRQDFLYNQKRIKKAIKNFQDIYNVQVLRTEYSGPKATMPPQHIIDSIRKIDFYKLDVVYGGDFSALTQDQKIILNQKELKDELNMFSAKYAEFKNNEENIEKLIFEARSLHQKYVAILNEDSTAQYLTKQKFTSNYSGWLSDRDAQNKSVEIKWKAKSAIQDLEELKHQNVKILNLLGKVE